MSVYKRGSMWYMDIVVKGHRVNKSTGVPILPTKKDKGKQSAIGVMELERRTLLNALEAGIHATPDISLSLAIERVYQDKWAENRDKEKTYRMAYKISDILSDPDILDIDNTMVLTLAKVLRSQGKSPATINRYLSVLKVIMRCAHREWDEIPKVPHFPMQKEDNIQLKVFTDKQIQRICAWFDNSCLNIYSDLTLFIVETGMRLSEALSLDWDDYNPDEAEIYIRHVNSKSGKQRVVPLSSIAKALIDSDRRMAAICPFDITINQAEYYWKQMKNRCSEIDGGWHTLRHTFASRLANKGVDIQVIRDLLGHSTVKVTERYAHVNKESLRKAVTREL